MYCSQCGAPVPEGSQVCPFCGAKLNQPKDNTEQRAVFGQTASQPAGSIRSTSQQSGAATSNDEATVLLEHDREPYSQANEIREPLYPDESATIEPDGLNIPYDSYQTVDAFSETYGSQPPAPLREPEAGVDAFSETYGSQPGVQPSYSYAPPAEFKPDIYFENTTSRNTKQPITEVPMAGYIPNLASPGHPNMYKENKHDIVAIVAGIVLVASIALIFVIVNPFGWGSSDDDSISATTTNTITSTDKSATLDEDSLITDDTSSGEATTEEDTTSTDESEKLDDDDTTSADTTSADTTTTDTTSADSTSADSTSADSTSSSSTSADSTSADSTSSSSTSSSSTSADSTSADSTSSSSTSSTTTTSDDDYVLSDSATHEYTRAELETMSNYELFLARNEIYARHGRRFKKDELQEYFDSKSWYTPLYDPDEFSETLLNDVEKANAYLMLDIEKSRDSPYVQP